MPKDKVYPYDDADTTLVNLENVSLSEVDIYIGSENESYDLDDSPFMNPFDHAKKGYDGAVEHYKCYFFRRYLSEPKFKNLTHELEGNVLGGWCYPHPSHGEVIIDLLRARSDEDKDVLTHIKSELDDIDNEVLGSKGYRELEAAKKELSKHI